MSQALTRYSALYASAMSRRRRPRTLTGLDRLTAWVQLKIRHQRTALRVLLREARQIDAMAASIRAHSEAALDEQVRLVRERFIRRDVTTDVVRRGLALVREVARRETGEEAYVVQLAAALGLYHGRIVEMLTGEGKTLTGSIAAPLLAWKHRSLHIFTVNDYLARRDAHSRGAIYARCGCTVGAIQQEMSPGDRFQVYARSIVYGTPKQITADYLRDQLRIGPLGSAWMGRAFLSRLGEEALASGAGPLIPGLRAALVDEADAVLIDEGVVPLIIAQPRRTDDMADVYRQAAFIASKLDEGPDYSIDALRRTSELKRRGRHLAAGMWHQLDHPIWKTVRRAEELVRQALVAKHCYLRGKQYEVVDGRVVIVDEYTGRFLADRTWEHGLHQAVEAKEGVDVTADRETLARMSFQRFFRSYPFLCGMTGTAADATREMEQVYARPVTRIPTHRPMIRKQLPTRVFLHGQDRWTAVLDEIERLHAANRPVLAGTPSIEASEHLSSRLAARGLEHRVLNALHDAEEAELVLDAGAAGAITVATNMAGRGTDIKLDPQARGAGGLAVILTEMHTAKRIDRQFIGRSGRQGDPGTAQIYASLDDELPRQYIPWAVTLLRRCARDGEIVWRSGARLALRLAQRRAEARARRSRASVLRQDDWIDKNLPGQ
ncbi:MAG: hypothetical protein KF866_02190 [Phycisphaeraceae bacterium]|nr:hypothetical protein [Phycisphaeraceae bacterium]